MAANAAARSAAGVGGVEHDRRRAVAGHAGGVQPVLLLRDVGLALVGPPRRRSRRSVGLADRRRTRAATAVPLPASELAVGGRRASGDGLGRGVRQARPRRRSLSGMTSRSQPTSSRSGPVRGRFGIERRVLAAAPEGDAPGVVWNSSSDRGERVAGFDGVGQEGRRRQRASAGRTTGSAWVRPDRWSSSRRSASRRAERGGRDRTDGLAEAGRAWHTARRDQHAAAANRMATAGEPARTGISGMVTDARRAR